MIWFTYKKLETSHRFGFWSHMIHQITSIFFCIFCAGIPTGVFCCRYLLTVPWIPVIHFFGLNDTGSLFALEWWTLGIIRWNKNEGNPIQGGSWNWVYHHVEVSQVRGVPRVNQVIRFLLLRPDLKIPILRNLHVFPWCRMNPEWLGTAMFVGSCTNLPQMVGRETETNGCQDAFPWWGGRWQVPLGGSFWSEIWASRRCFEMAYLQNGYWNRKRTWQWWLTTGLGVLYSSFSQTR